MIIPSDMKNKKKPVAKPVTPNTKKLSGSPQTPFTAELNEWLGKHRYKVIGGLIVLWVIIRASLFHTVANGPLYKMYAWKESDSYFFDEQARALAAGDWLNRQPLHPYHGWHQEFADYYFKQHPDKRNQILAANPGRDSTFIPGKVLWNEWYGGNRYHQEPLYAYLLAFLYVLTGNGIYWMMVLQCLVGAMSGVILWLITRRFFDDATALLACLFYTFCGTVLFQESLILRTCWSVFFTLLTVWTFQKALDRGTRSAFLVSGITIGLAYLLQSFFVLFLIGALGIYVARERKLSKTLLQNSGLIAGGFLLVCLPVILRNTAVGAPLFSTTSTGAITFVATNVHGTNAISRWQPEAAKSAEIMGVTNGKFLPAALESLGNHSVGSYLQLVWLKFQSVLNGAEWPNNENYYFYREIVPVVKMAFLNFYWIVGLGVAGIFFALYNRKKHPALYLAILLHLGIMIGFYVLGRLRAPLAVLLLPFAAYCVIECLRFAQTESKVWFAKIAVVALCVYFLAYRFYPPNVTTLDRTDYHALYETAYLDRVKNNAESKQTNEAILIHEEFLKYQPKFITDVKVGKVLKSPAEIDMLDYFANHHQIQSYLYEDAGNNNMAAKEMEKFNTMKTVADNSRRNRTR